MDLTNLFPNRDQECAISALANLLVLLHKDRPTAEKLYKEARRHPFVFSNGGVIPTTVPAILKASTNQYRAFVGARREYVALYQQTAKMNYKSHVYDAYEAEVKRALASGEITEEFYSGANPAIIVTLTKPWDGHAMIYCGGNRFISNGDGIHIEPNSFIIDATIEVRRI